jgi:uncharacterized protein YcbK (DUF882 family)
LPATEKTKFLVEILVIGKKIDWTDPSAMLTRHFSIFEALYLSKWGRMANESDGLNDQIKENLWDFFCRMDRVRDFLGEPILVFSAFRPIAYNKIIPGAAPQSSHTEGKAGDWCVPKVSCDEIRMKLIPELAAFGLRMENLPRSIWVHTDTRPARSASARFFIP